MRKLILLTTVLILMMGSVAAAQENAEPEQAVVPGKLVTAIEVKGNKNISSNAIVSKMKSRIASLFQENIINDDIKRLYLLGFFEDIKINTEAYKDGLKIIVEVRERPLIDKITFSGIKVLNIKDEKLKSTLKSKEGQYLDYPALSEDIRTLLKMYEKRGYGNAQITHEEEFDKEADKVKVKFIINEGRRLSIKDIIVQGNKAFPESRILKIIKTKKAWFFNAGALKEDVLLEDVERVRSFYQKNGYTDVIASSEIKPDLYKPYLLFITIKINEGRKYIVGNVSIGGNKEIKEKEILSKLESCLPGKIFNQEALKSDIANIQGLYFDRGFIACVVQDAAYVNPSTARVDITYNITENEICYVNKIKIRGNIKTKEVVIRRELKIYPGDRFDGEKLRRSKERLQNLGFFDEQQGIKYDTEDTDVSDKKDLVVEVKEAKTGAFSFGGGYSTVDAFMGFIEVEQKNFDWKNFPYFTGAGQNLKFRASLGTLTQGFDLSFTEPWLFDYPISFGFDAYKRFHKRDENVGYGYDEEVVGGDLRLGRKISDYVRLDLMYKLDEIEITNITANVSNDLKQEYGKNIISSLTPTITFDSRDNVRNPTKGDVFIGSFETAGGPFGGDKDFWKFYGKAAHYVPLFKNSVLELKTRLGVAQSYGNSSGVSIYERFFAGGASTIRGYEERKIGPIDSVSKDPLGGESILVENFEYTYPILSFLKTAVFYDTGNVWAKAADISLGELKSGVGFGFRIKTPIGPITLDYGIPLNKEPGEDRKKSGRFHFSASHGF
ncbi:MAG: outer membrane protein assembly factor BamA [Candidatus Omnitrophota bacterium]|nr:outer membrane protein assembly factor BamA [Candidatus Omnitrophota bacterium]